MGGIIYEESLYKENKAWSMLDLAGYGGIEASGAKCQHTLLLFLNCKKFTFVYLVGATQSQKVGRHCIRSEINMVGLLKDFQTKYNEWNLSLSFVQSAVTNIKITPKTTYLTECTHFLIWSQG